MKMFFLADHMSALLLFRNSRLGEGVWATDDGRWTMGRGPSDVDICRAALCGVMAVERPAARTIGNLEVFPGHVRHPGICTRQNTKYFNISIFQAL